MEVTGEQTKEFPSPSEEEEPDSEEEMEEGELENTDKQLNSNSNHTADRGTQRSPGARQWTLSRTTKKSGSLPENFEDRPRMSTGGETRQGSGRNCLNEEDPDLDTEDEGHMSETFELMQEYMIEKGLIDSSMTEHEMREFLSSNIRRRSRSKSPKGVAKKRKPTQEKIRGMITKIGDVVQQQNRSTEVADSESEVTIYRRAVDLASQDNHVAQRQVTDQQIDKLIADARRQSLDEPRRSGSSEELMDTSDECDALIIQNNLISDNSGQADKGAQLPVKKRTLTQEEHAKQITRESELARATLYDVPGRSFPNVMLMDQDYQMLDSHLDDSIKRKIQSFEYVDFSKLSPGTMMINVLR